MISCRQRGKCHSIGDKNKQLALNHPIICTICDSWAPSWIMGNRYYVIMLGIVGTAISVFDAIRILNSNIPAKPSCPHIPLGIERDLKLITSVFVIEHCTLIMIGAVTELPILHIPWLIMQICVIIVEIVAFITGIIVNGLHIQFRGALQAMIVIFHWLEVFCLCIQQFKKSSL